MVNLFRDEIGEGKLLAVTAAVMYQLVVPGACKLSTVMVNSSLGGGAQRV